MSKKEEQCDECKRLQEMLQDSRRAYESQIYETSRYRTLYEDSKNWRDAVVAVANSGKRG